MADSRIDQHGVIGFEPGRIKSFAPSRRANDAFVATVDELGQLYLWDPPRPIPFLTSEHLTRFWRQWWAEQVIVGIGFTTFGLVVATEDDILLPGLSVMAEPDHRDREVPAGWPAAAGEMQLRLARYDDNNGVPSLGRSGVALITGREHIAVLDQDGVVRRWQYDRTFVPSPGPAALALWRPLPEHRLPFTGTKPARLIAASADGGHLLVGAADPQHDEAEAPWLIELRSGESRLLAGLRGSDVVALDGAELAVASDDGRIRRLTADEAADPGRQRDGTLVAEVDGPAVTALHMPTDGRILAGDEAGSVFSWDAQGTFERAGGAQHTGPVTALAAADKRGRFVGITPLSYAYSLAEDGTVRRWNLRNLASRLSRPIAGSGRLARLHHMDAGGTAVIIEDQHGELRVLDTADGHVLADERAADLRTEVARELAGESRRGPDGTCELQVSERALSLLRYRHPAWMSNPRRVARVSGSAESSDAPAAPPVFCDARFSPDGRSVFAVLATPDPDEGGLWSYDLLDYAVDGTGKPRRRILLERAYGITPAARLQLSADGTEACVELGWLCIVHLAGGGEHTWVNLGRADTYPFTPAVLSADLHTVAWPIPTGEIAVGTWEEPAEG